MVKGWDNLLSGRQKPTGSVHKSRKIKDTERMFSMSSVTVPSAEEVAAWESTLPLHAPARRRLAYRARTSSRGPVRR